MRNFARLTNAAQDLAGVPRDPDKRKMPLRKVVERFSNDKGTLMERFECGHEEWQKWNRYGPTTSDRRRCKQCFEQGQGLGI